MNFVSTRGGNELYTAKEAFLKVFADNNGLLVPERFYKMTQEDFDKTCNLDYPERVAYFLSKIFDDFNYESLLEICKNAYACYGESEPVILSAVSANEFFLELNQGATASNKDLPALVAPYLLKECLNSDFDTQIINVLCADTTDTCIALANAFKNSKFNFSGYVKDDENTLIQQLQLTSLNGENVKIISVLDDFISANNAIKRTFSTKEKTIFCDSKNIVFVFCMVSYYFSAYCDLINNGVINCGDKIKIVLPVESGCEILACNYAKNMGLPVEEIIFSASKENCFLKLITKGVVEGEISDILERILFELTGRCGDMVSNVIKEVNTNGKMKLNGLQFVTKPFSPFAYNYEDVVYSIAFYTEEFGYLLDVKSAAAVSAKANFYGDCCEEGIFLNVSTTSPYKYAEDLFTVLFEGSYDSIFEAISDINDEFGTDLPINILKLETEKATPILNITVDELVNNN